MTNFFKPTSYPVMLSPDLKHAWINIPKNCSSFIQKVLDDNGWNMLAGDLADSVLLVDSIEKIVILRDPVQRWISGFAETFGVQDDWDSSLKINLDDLEFMLDNDAWWKTVYHNPVMCHHTELQHRYIGSAKNVQYIKMQDKEPNGNSVTNPNKFYRELSDYIRYTGGTSEFQFWSELTNPVTNNETKLRIYNKIIKVLDNNPKIQYNIKDVHGPDYDLFNNLKRFSI